MSMQPVRTPRPARRLSPVRGGLLVAACLTPLVVAAQTGQSRVLECDLVLRGGRVVDGTGNPWFLADVGIRGDRIAYVGPAAGVRGAREVAVRGRVVAPGFIDMHSHSDDVLLQDGAAQSKIRQGVTTEVLGEGSSQGPFVGKLPPKETSAAGRTARWTRLGEYFSLAERSGIAVNIAGYVGLDNVWRSVMGNSHARPGTAERGEMRRLIREAMEEGAFGLSTMLAMPPGSLTNTEDLVELAREIRPYGGIFTTHNRNEGTGVLEAVQEAITVGEKAGVRVDVIHLKIADQQLWGRMGEVVGRIEAARTRGVDVQANVYPYTRGSNNLASIIPPWAHEGGSARMRERLRSPADRARMKQEIRNGIPGWYNHYTAVGGDWKRMLVAGAGKYQGQTVDRVLASRAVEVGSPDRSLEGLFDLLLETGGSVPTVYEHHTERDMNLAMTQPWCSIGSDGSALAAEGPLRRGNPHPRSFGTFPRVLGVYVRERKVLTLEDAVRKMTSLNAARLGLRDRGALLPGMFADVTVFDPARVADRATYENPFQYPVGIETVLVN
ncbi:MAG: D-aminoacylase, partial [Armatimonadetes bacterium]|nr:D-aminoacylase [Armatimonadota bacterium]